MGSSYLDVVHDRVVIFDGAKQVLYRIDVGRKTYMEMTKDDVERMGAQMTGMMSQMQAQMANMPPAQRGAWRMPMRWFDVSMNPPVPGVEASTNDSDDTQSALPVVSRTL